MLYNFGVIHFREYDLFLERLYAQMKKFYQVQLIL